MRKGLRLIKRVLALVIVLAFSIESFAAVVGDNDGAAFITKAEFDSLKSSFQEQINRYNQSIDNKIDGAISSYLEGVKIKSEERLKNVSSVLSYPLNIYMSNKSVFNINEWSNKDLSRDKIFKPGYLLHFWGVRNNRWYLYDEAFEANMPSDFFYVTEKKDGKWLLTSAQKFLDMKLVLSTPVVIWSQDNGDATTYLRLVVSMGHESWVAQETNTNTYNIPLNNQNKVLFSVGDGWETFPFKVDSWMAFINEISISVDSNGDTGFCFDRIKGSGTQCFANGSVGHHLVYSDYVNSISAPVDRIWNANASFSDDFVYVRPNNKLWLTNNNYWRTLLRSTPAPSEGYYIYMRNNVKKDNVNQKVNFVIEGGLTLEPVGYGDTTRDKEYKSLWKTNDIYYDVTCPVSKDVIECCLTKGILLTEFPNKEIEYAEIKFDVDLSNYDSTDVANLPKIVFSKGEIGYAEQESVQNNCITIFNDLNTATGEKVLTLTPGTNTIYIKKPAQLSKLYYKVFFANDYVGSVKITEPEVKILA